MTKETTEEIAKARATTKALRGGPNPLARDNAIIELADERDRLAAELEASKAVNTRLVALLNEDSYTSHDYCTDDPDDDLSEPCTDDPPCWSHRVFAKIKVTP